MPIADKLYYEYADELLLHIREPVELENGINFNGNDEIAILLTEEKLDGFAANIPKSRKVHLGHEMLSSESQKKLFKKRGVISRSEFAANKKTAVRPKKPYCVKVNMKFQAALTPETISPIAL